MRHPIPLTLLFTMATLVGCSQQAQQPTAETSGGEAESTVVAAVNEFCPIMAGSKVTDDGGRFDWNGETVGFCCPECIEAFSDMSDEEKKEALASSSEASNEDDHGDHSHDEHDEDEGTESS